MQTYIAWVDMEYAMRIKDLYACTDHANESVCART